MDTDVRISSGDANAVVIEAVAHDAAVPSGDGNGAGFVFVAADEDNDGSDGATRVLSDDVVVMSEDASSDAFVLHHTYAVVPAPHTSQQILEKVSASTFCLPPDGEATVVCDESGAGSDPLPHHFILPDMVDGSFQLEHNGEVYKLVVHDPTASAPGASQHKTQSTVQYSKSGIGEHQYHQPALQTVLSEQPDDNGQQHQQQPSRHHDVENNAGADHPEPVLSEQQEPACTDTDPDACGADEEGGRRRCVVCETRLCDDESAAVSLHDSVLTASGDSAAVVLHQLALEAGCSAEQLLLRLQLPAAPGGGGNGAVLVCHSCAALLDSVDSLHWRLEQLQQRLHHARQQLIARLMSTDDRLAAPRGRAAVERMTVSQCGASVVGENTVCKRRVNTASASTKTLAINNRVSINTRVQHNTANRLDCEGVVRPESGSSACNSPPLPSRLSCSQRRGGGKSCRVVVNECGVCGCLLAGPPLLRRLHELWHRQRGQSAPPAPTPDFGTAVFKCATCEVELATQRALCAHHGACHDEAVWRCAVCWHVADDEASLQRHVAAHELANTCHVCGAECVSSERLAEHMRAKHWQWCGCDGGRCEVCDTSFSSVRALVQHASSEHDITETSRCFNDDDGGDTQSDDDDAQTDACVETSSSTLSPARRKQQQSPKKQRQKASKKSPTASKRRRFNCNVCQRSYLSRDNLNNHCRQHTGERPFSCGECSHTFSSRQACRAHMRAFHCVNPFICDQCGRRCESRSAYERHVKSHSASADHQCSICGKKMTTSYSLNTHMKAVHLGAMPYRCDVCGRKFAYKSSLTMHEYSHDERRQFMCEVCGKHVSSRNSLRTHMFSHSARKPYPCDLCDSSFSRRDLLARHRLQVHGIQSDRLYSRLMKRSVGQRRPPLPVCEPLVVTQSAVEVADTQQQVAFVVRTGATVVAVSEPC